MAVTSSSSFSLSHLCNLCACSLFLRGVVASFDSSFELEEEEGGALRPEVAGEGVTVRGAAASVDERPDDFFLLWDALLLLLGSDVFVVFVLVAAAATRRRLLLDAFGSVFNEVVLPDDRELAVRFAPLLWLLLLFVAVRRVDACGLALDAAGAVEELGLDDDGIVLDTGGASKESSSDVCRPRLRVRVLIAFMGFMVK